MSVSDSDHTLTPLPERGGEYQTEEETKSTANISSAVTEESGPRYPYLEGLRLYNLIAALMLGMLLIGLDINIVATVTSSSSSIQDLYIPLLRSLFTGCSNYNQSLPQSQGCQLVWFGFSAGLVGSTTPFHFKLPCFAYCNITSDVRCNRLLERCTHSSPPR
jgi:hypothetical protein